METTGTPATQAHGSLPDQDLNILNEIGQILSSTLELRDAFAKAMQILSDKMNMRRAALVLLDDSNGRLRTEAAIGMTSEEIEKGRYALGEGVTGNVVATGRARVIPDVRNEFSNRSHSSERCSSTSFRLSISPM